MPGEPVLPGRLEDERGSSRGRTTTSFSPALADTFAIVTRWGARLAVGVRELLAAVEEHMRTVADELDRPSTG